MINNHIAGNGYNNEIVDIKEVILSCETNKLSYVTLSQPTGLHFSNPLINSKHVCLLQRYAIDITPEFKRVFQQSNVLSPGKCKEIIDTAETVSKYFEVQEFRL